MGEGIQVRRAAAADAAELGRLLVEFNAEFELAHGEGASFLDLNTGETDTAARGLYEAMGFSNREGGPDGPAMLYYEREI